VNERDPEPPHFPNRANGQLVRRILHQDLKPGSVRRRSEIVDSNGRRRSGAVTHHQTAQAEQRPNQPGLRQLAVPNLLPDGFGWRRDPDTIDFTQVRPGNQLVECGHVSSIADETHLPACVMTTTLSRTAILPARGVGVSFAATVNVTGLSPDRGMLPVTVIQGTSDTADHTHRSCVAPPHVLGWLC
jgi:hypothetical protein